MAGFDDSVCSDQELFIHLLGWNGVERTNYALLGVRFLFAGISKHTDVCDQKNVRNVNHFSLPRLLIVDRHQDSSIETCILSSSPFSIYAVH